MGTNSSASPGAVGTLRNGVFRHPLPSIHPLEDPGMWYVSVCYYFHKSSLPRCCLSWKWASWHVQRGWSMILLMVQKSHSHLPGMYKTPVTNGINYQTPNSKSTWVSPPQGWDAHSPAWQFDQKEQVFSLHVYIDRPYTFIFAMFVAHLTWKLLRLLEYSKLSSHNICEIKLKSKVSTQPSPLPITRELAPSNHILRKVLAQRNLLQVGLLKTWKYATYRSLWTTRLVVFWKKHKCNIWEDDEILGRSHHRAEQAERRFIRLPSQKLQLFCRFVQCHVCKMGESGKAFNQHRWIKANLEVSLPGNWNNQLYMFQLDHSKSLHGKWFFHLFHPF